VARANIYGAVKAVPFQTPVTIVPTEVKEEVTTLDARVVPVKVPAGATTAAAEIAVIRPLPLTVTIGIAVEEPKDPVFEFTVLRVTAPVSDMVASPLILTGM
jgi:hypothetical protein